MQRSGGVLLLLWLFVSVACASVQAQQIGRSRSPAAGPIAEHSYFFVGGSYVGDPAKQVMHGQMFVEKLTPARPHQRYPIVLIHGAAQTATNWMGTPDGREGWAEFLCNQGYQVYMVDQPARGRSAWQEGIDGKVRTFDAQTIEVVHSPRTTQRLASGKAAHAVAGRGPEARPDWRPNI